MKAQYFVAVLFATSLYGMYFLYKPFLLSIIIAALLAVSTSNIQSLLENIFHSKFLAAFISSILLASLFFAPLGYFLATLTIQLNSVEVESYYKISDYIKTWIDSPPEFLQFLKPYVVNTMKDISSNDFTTTIFSITAKVGAFSAGFLKKCFLNHSILLFCSI